MADPESTPDLLKTRRDEEKEKRRQAILDAAERVIAKHGWENTDFGKVADRARLSRSLIYVYFPKRDDLFHAVCARGLAYLEEQFRAAIARHKTGLDQVDALGRAYHAFSQKEPLYFELISQYQEKEVEARRKEGPEDDAHEYGRRCVGLVVQALATGIADGSVRKSVGDPRPAAVSVWAFTHGLIQIATRKEVLLKESFELTSAKMMEHGFALLRSSLAEKT